MQSKIDREKKEENAYENVEIVVNRVIEVVDQAVEVTGGPTESYGSR